ncbi:DUF4062 domain-containing protein [Paenibacillus cymbidii]|uniref:DUF4062 domain-containing protein n=1 Tax=Paenibacillus cymbidii TaxID=1639034 RepID=UPI0010820B77|nr:DUF4062 domain-containing protein [Paenibacillus cymbidii]
MKKKLQVFVSSTFEDLKEERQVAVQAILNSGHIPAGMELFTAGDETQKEIIMRWIEESDVYLLILGGRYGSIDKTTNKSYTHWEYEYAGKIKKPRFAIVIDENALNEKIKKYGVSVWETENLDKYKEFRNLVLEKICKFYTDTRDIQLAIHQKMAEYEKDEKLTGWVNSKDVPNVGSLIKQIDKLTKENAKLISSSESKKKNLEFHDGYSFEELCKKLNDIKINIPGSISSDGKSITVDLLGLYVSNQNLYATGITNHNDSNKKVEFLFYTLAPKLLTFGLLEKVGLPGGTYQRIQNSSLGNRFLAKIMMSVDDVEQLNKILRPS